MGKFEELFIRLCKSVSYKTEDFYVDVLKKLDEEDDALEALKTACDDDIV